MNVLHEKETKKKTRDLVK